MNKEAYDFVMPPCKAMYRAKRLYGADLDDGREETTSAYYNVGMDAVLKDMAITILDTKKSELDKYERSLEAYETSHNIFDGLSKEINDEVLKEMLHELVNQNNCYHLQSERAHFIEGFMAGYKLLKNANYA